jgi:SET domain-containing protein
MISIPLHVGISPTYGVRGLLATRDLQVGECIEECPLLFFPVDQQEAVHSTVFANYYFLWDDDRHAFALGYGSLYNHSYHANVRYQRDFERQVIRFMVAKPICAGDEVTVNYNGDPDDETPLDPDYGI